MRIFLRSIAIRQDDDIYSARRGKIIFAISSLAIVISLLLMISALFSGDIDQFLGISIDVLIYTCILLLLRYKQGSLAGVVLVTFFYYSIVSPMLSSAEYLTINIFFTTFPLFLASLVLRPVMVLILMLVNILLISVLLWQHQAALAVMDWQYAISAIFFTVVLTLCVFIGAITSQRYLNLIYKSQKQIRSYSNTLEYDQQLLEQRVKEHTGELEQALLLAENQAKALQQQLGNRESYRKTLRDLSVPSISVNQDTIIIPLVGSLDEERLQIFQEQTLYTIERSRAHTVILDVTGVPIIDTFVAEGIVRVVEATHLLGARVLLVGIRPEVAQTIVQLQLPLTSIETFSTLKTALQTLIPQATYQQVSESAL